MVVKQLYFLFLWKISSQNFDGTDIDLSKVKLEYIKFQPIIKTVTTTENGKTVQKQEEEYDKLVGPAFGRTKEEQKLAAPNIKVLGSPKVSTENGRTATFDLQLPVLDHQVLYNYRFVYEKGNEPVVISGIALLKVPSLKDYEKKFKTEQLIQEQLKKPKTQIKTTVKNNYINSQKLQNLI
ncbi:hypothetical protein [Mesomycoplasma hyorhinis]|uniref:hypothetical protein n=1 Tax=Mesomycoplasma hyorhinis TaxID=2100 RepID=UPI001F38063A|nr:hypothetical protein [Mesomycoplasma hyorhinis]